MQKLEGEKVRITSEGEFRTLNKKDEPFSFPEKGQQGRGKTDVLESRVLMPGICTD